MKNYKETFLRLSGAFLFLIGVLAIIHAFIVSIPELSFYFCYWALILIGIGIYFKKSLLIVSQLNIVLIPLIIWDLDFFYQLTVGRKLWNLADYVFLQESFLETLISLQHVYIIPIALFALYLMGVKRKDAWKLSLVQIFVIYVLTRIFSGPETNINWVYFSTLNLKLLEPYFVNWFLFFGIIIFVTNYFLCKVYHNNS